METTNNLPANTAKELFSKDIVKKKFEELMGNRSNQFMTSVLQIVASNEMLSKAEPSTVLNAAITAAALDLPINNNLGFAYIVPYNDRRSNKCVAQFQMGYKGFIQLAQRSGQFKTISASPIFDGQLIEMNPLTGFKFDFSKKTSEKIIGYAAFFSLLNGFEKTLYMSVEEINKHAGKYSQTFKKGFGVWKDDFDGMACKTVIKLLLSKFAPLSVEMQKSIVTDQAIVKNMEGSDLEYTDHQVIEEIDPEDLRAQYEFVKENLTKEQRLNIERILENKEVGHYKQVKDILQGGNQ